MIPEVERQLEADLRGGEERQPRRVVRVPPPAQPRARDQLRVALASPGALRQAFLVREVLGPPVALRDGPVDRPA